MTQSAYTEYLTQKLIDVNDKLSSSFHLQLEKLKTDEALLQTALEVKTRQDLITHLERDVEIEDLKKLNTSLIKSMDLDPSLMKSNIRLTNTASAGSNHALINYLEKELAIEKLKTLNEKLELQQKLMHTKPVSHLRTTVMSDYLLKQALMNDNLRSHFLVHKPGAECNICSPNSIYINTLRHSSDNLRTFLKNSMDENKLKNSVTPNVVS